MCVRSFHSSEKRSWALSHSEIKVKSVNWLLCTISEKNACYRWWWLLCKQYSQSNGVTKKQQVHNFMHKNDEQNVIETNEQWNERKKMSGSMRYLT